MEPLARVTPLYVEQRWIAGLRAKGLLWRLHCLVDMTSLCWRAAYDAMRRARPAATPEERKVWLLRERYGDAVAQRVAERCQQHEPHHEVCMTTNHTLWDALLPRHNSGEQRGLRVVGNAQLARANGPRRLVDHLRG